MLIDSAGGNSLINSYIANILKGFSAKISLVILAISEQDHPTVACGSVFTFSNTDDCW
jgi:hypothetical protein